MFVWHHFESEPWQTLWKLTSPFEGDVHHIKVTQGNHAKQTKMEYVSILVNKLTTAYRGCTANPSILLTLPFIFWTRFNWICRQSQSFISSLPSRVDKEIVPSKSSIWKLRCKTHITQANHKWERKTIWRNNRVPVKAGQLFVYSYNHSNASGLNKRCN